jgi:hypothetical protein
VSLRCVFGIHEWRVEGVEVWGRYTWGIWEVWRECRICGATSYIHITNARKAERLRAEKALSGEQP